MHVLLVGDDVSIATRAANLVVSLTHTCAEELVSSTMLDGLLTTVVTAHIFFKKINFFLDNFSISSHNVIMYCSFRMCWRSQVLV